MAVNKIVAKRQVSRNNEKGFTLIESVVAMGLFASVTFLLVTVINDFMMDSFPAASVQALTIAESQIADVEASHNFESTAKDTSGFRVIRDVVVDGELAKVDVTVSPLNEPCEFCLEMEGFCQTF